MVVKDYEQLSETDKTRVAKAWAQIADGLSVYEEVTGAYDLADIVNDDLWETIGYQKDAE